MPTIYINNKTDLPERKAYDFYPTPEEFVRCALTKLKFRVNSFYPFYPESLLDPGAGTGVWGKVARDVWKGLVDIFGIEIRDDVEPHPCYDGFIRGDFLNWPVETSSYDLIVGNPPYSLGEEFIEKSWSLLRDGGYLGFLLKLSFLESKKRYNLYFNGMEHMKPKFVWVSVRRISFTGNKKSNADAYCFVIWEKGWVGKTTLDWLYWEYD